MNEDQFVSYFENLAIQSKEINHMAGGVKSFFYIEDGYNLDEFDNALRKAVQSPTVMLVADDGMFNDNASASYNQEMDGQLLFIGKLGGGRTIRSIRAMCLPIALNFLAKMKYDAHKKQILPNPKDLVHFRIDRVPYEKIGPLSLEWYGYSVSFKFICPFGFSVTSAIWRDID